VNKRNNMDGRVTNDELARRLFQRDKGTKSSPSEPGQPLPEALASRRQPVEERQTWTLGKPADGGLGPVSERERRALFAALRKGTQANLGREPTVAELVSLVEQVDQARALVSAARDAIDGQVSVHVDGGKITFRGSMQSLTQRREVPNEQGAA
jgi:hypothetical protein